MGKEKLLFLFDIDGTLFDNANDEVPASALRALQELHKTADIGIATGRARFMLYSIEELMPLIKYSVLINGRYILDGENVIFEEPLSGDVLERLVRDMEELNIIYGFQGSDDEAISKIDEEIIRFFCELRLDLPPLNKNYHLQKKVYQAWCFCNEEEVETLRRKHPDLQFIRWLHVGYDILPKSSSKSKGMKMLAEKIGIGLENIVAFGDGDNDYEMLRDAGLGIAMGNGTEKAKAVADYVTDAVDRDGIYKALIRFGFIKRQNSKSKMLE
ncbi:MAG: Cof-type HAD-IIB family hydrolase [Bacilli bacterium]|mgnify:FL=1|jgi:Cof subfamily protein (haloacid dehalogenase superfamily)